MNAKLIAAALLGAALAAPSVQAQTFARSDRFTHTATGFDVRVRHSGGAMDLKGTHPKTGETFKVHVSGSGRVTGVWKGEPVNFVMGKEAGRATVIALAQ